MPRLLTIKLLAATAVVVASECTGTLRNCKTSLDECYSSSSPVRRCTECKAGWALATYAGVMQYCYADGSATTVEPEETEEESDTSPLTTAEPEQTTEEETTTTPYDCLTRELWMADKTAWCCENESLGCPVTTTEAAATTTRCRGRRCQGGKGGGRGRRLEVLDRLLEITGKSAKNE